MTLPLPTCRHRGEQVTANRWICHSKKLVIPGRVISEDFCIQECLYVDHAEENGLGRFPWNANTVLHPGLTVADFTERIARPNASFPTGWQRWEVAQLAMRRLLEETAKHPPSYPGGFEGRGIVIAAGGPVYFSCAYVCVKVLRELGCELPVEFWHLGTDELDERMAELVLPLGVTCRDARTVAPQPRVLHGWELKPFAMLHSSFEEVLFLDADNVPARDPTFLFEDSRYRRAGAVFWPDLPPAINPYEWIPQLTWDVAAIGWRDGPAFETGQILVNKSKCWHELVLTMHLNEYSDFWYRYVYGDKDTFKLAWHKKQRRYSLPSRLSDWRWPAIFQYDLDGELVFTHACQGKQQLKNGERLHALPMGETAVEAASDLHRRWSDRRNGVPSATSRLRNAQQRPCSVASPRG